MARVDRHGEVGRIERASLRAGTRALELTEDRRLGRDRLAGFQLERVDRDDVAHRRERTRDDGRDRSDAEDRETLGQPLAPPAPDLRGEPLDPRREVGRSVGRDERTEELCLPVLVLSALPPGDELGAMEDVAIEHLRDARGEGEALRPVLVIGEVAAHLGKRRVLDVRRQQRSDAPRERRGVKGALLTGGAVGRERIHPCPRRHEVRVRPHAVPLRQLGREPPGERAGRHEDRLLRERRRQRRLDHLRETVEERFELIRPLYLRHSCPPLRSLRTRWRIGREWIGHFTTGDVFLASPLRVIGKRCPG